MKLGSLLQFTFRPWPHEGPRMMEDRWKTSPGSLHTTHLLRSGKSPPPLFIKEIQRHAHTPTNVCAHKFIFHK